MKHEQFFPQGMEGSFTTNSEPLDDELGLPDYTKVKPKTESAAMQEAWDDAVNEEEVETETTVVESGVEASPAASSERLVLGEEFRVDPEEGVESSETMETVSEENVDDATNVAVLTAELGTLESELSESEVETDEGVIELATEQTAPAALGEARDFVFKEIDGKIGFTHTERAAAHRLVELIERSDDSTEQASFLAQLHELPTFLLSAQDNRPEDFARIANAELATIEVGHRPDDPEHANEFATARVMYEQLQETLARFPHDDDPADQLLLEMAWQKKAKQELENLMNLTERYHLEGAAEKEKVKLKEQATAEREAANKTSYKVPPPKRRWGLYPKYVWAAGETSPRLKRSLWQRVWGGKNM